MDTMNLTGLASAVATKITPMVEEIVKAHSDNFHSFHVVGSAAIADFNENISDINSVVVLHNMDLAFITFLAPLGKKYGKKRIAAPLVMTPEYIQGSLDAFPIEFLDFKLIHRTVYGSDILKDLSITMPNLRLQCERELKTRLIGLRQGYLSSLGKKENLSLTLVRSFTGSMALFRAIITLRGAEPPIPRVEVIKRFGDAAKIDAGIFERLLALKAGRIKPSEQELQTMFEQYYHALEAAATLIDGLHV
jgi:hypothetical protein